MNLQLRSQGLAMVSSTSPDMVVGAQFLPYLVSGDMSAGTVNRIGIWTLHVWGNFSFDVNKNINDLLFVKSLSYTGLSCASRPEEVSKLGGASPQWYIEEMG